MRAEHPLSPKRAGCIAATLCGLILFSVTGYFIATPTQLFTVSVVWLIAVGLIAAAIVALFWGAAAYMWIRVRNLGSIYPDENGDLPVIRIGRHLVNLNLIPYHTYRVTQDGKIEARDQDSSFIYRAWMVYLATRGRKASGSPPTAAFGPAERLLPESEELERPEQEFLVTQPGQSRLVDAVVQEL